VFKGTYEHRIDPKGRVPVPAEFRRALGLGGVTALVVTLLDECLAVYPPAEWDRLEAQLRALPAFSRPVKALTRLLASRAADCELDQQGRILLPAGLREAAGLRQEAVIIGVLNRFEVWSPERWSGFVEASERVLEDAALDVQWPLPPADPTPPTGVPRRRHPQEKPSR
jgi:transcriptional regulator MraZ